MNSASFKGSFVNNVNIKHREDNEYKPYKASFVELNPKDKQDLSIFKDLEHSWMGASSYALCDDAVISSKNLNDDRMYFALTSQNKDFHKMDPEKVLGLVEMTKGTEENYINFLQVHPDNMTQKPMGKVMKKFLTLLNGKKNNLDVPGNEYKGIGTSILDSMKKISDKSLSFYATDTEMSFFKKNGFKKTNFLFPNHVTWLKK